MTTPSSVLRFITAGSVDDGKSTLIGRLLYDSQTLLADQVAALYHGKYKRTAEGVPDFAQHVYLLARAIAPGQTRSYGDLADALGGKTLARAVGQALGANPFAPVVPCHRILASHGVAGGFSASGGTRTKLSMLEFEGAVLGDGSSLPLFG